MKYLFKHLHPFSFFFLFYLLLRFFLFLYREYLATFKKTVAMHEVFLQRIAAHPQLKNDVNFEVFLSFDQDVSKTQIFIPYVSS